MKKMRDGIKHAFPHYKPTLQRAVMLGPLRHSTYMIGLLHSMDEQQKQLLEIKSFGEFSRTHDFPNVILSMPAATFC